MRLGPRLLPFADAAIGRAAARPAAAPVAVPGLGRHGRRAAERHAQPRDDRRTRRAGLARRADGLAAAAVRAVPRADRLPLRHLTARCSAGGACPIIWIGTLLQFGGLAIMPFALIVLSGDTRRPGRGSAMLGAALAFLLVGAGLHTTQTAGLALATDLAPGQRAAARRRAALRHAAGRHGRQRARLRRAAAPISARCA